MRLILRSLSIVLIMFGAVVLSSCLDSPTFNDPAVQLEKEVNAIDTYLANAGTPNVIKHSSGIRMAIEVLGNGLPARGNSVIDIDYVGKLFDPASLSGEGVLFDEGNIDETDVSSKGKLTNLIQGWQIALTRLPVGSSAKLYIPSYWAYGVNAIKDSQGTVIIPSNSTLVFHIDFNDVVETTEEINRFKADTTAIETYLSETEYETDPTGVRYVITDEGDGNSPSIYSKIKFKYKYYLLTDDETVVAEGDQAPGEGFDSRPVDYIQAFLIGITKIREGGKITMYAPSLYCFGPGGLINSGGVNIVPANANLKIEIEFQSIEGI